MSEKSSKKPSGAYYRKRKQEKDVAIQKEAGAMKRFCIVKNSQIKDRSENTNVVDKAEDIESEICIGENDNVSAKEVSCEETSELHVSKEEKIIKTEKANQWEGISLSSDPAHWPSNINNGQIQFLIQNKPIPKKDIKYPINNEGRAFSNSYYTRVLVNGESYDRNWLIYSHSTDKIFCLCCKLFSIQNTPMATDGFSDWQHATRHLSRHEKCSPHMSAYKTQFTLLKNLEKERTIDKQEQKIFKAEKMYWYAVIERICCVVQFLAGQNLALRGSSDRLFDYNNGNFLKVIEMIAKFDPVMSEHIRRVQIKEDSKITTAYLGNIIQNEIITLIADETVSLIIKLIKQAKYFSIILDCTSDKSRVEQMTFVVRFVEINKEKECEICECFLGFHQVTDQTGEALARVVLHNIEEYGLSVQDLRGQNYDNGSNMKGKHKGVQKRILDINPRAFYVPCSPHSLNLAVNDSAKCSIEAVDFFGTLQQVYNFLSPSTERWEIFCKYLSRFTVKPLSDTRWSSRIDTVKPFRYQIGEIYDALIEISEAQCLATKIKSFKFLCSVVIWHKILSNVNVVSLMLQQSNLDVTKCNDVIQDLIQNLSAMRNDEEFETCINEAKELADVLEAESKFPEMTAVRRKNQPTRIEETKDEAIQDPRQKYKVNFFFAVLDVAIGALSERFEMLNNLYKIFSFLDSSSTLKCIAKEELLQRCKDVQLKLTDSKTNDSDVNSRELQDEICSLTDIFEENLNPLEMLNFMVKSDLQLAFPNFYVLLRILLTLLVSVASGEMSFSKLKLIKNYLRSTMTQDRLSSLAVISIERAISENLDIANLIRKFAELKARRVSFL